jgi:hypothetical protein
LQAAAAAASRKVQELQDELEQAQADQAALQTKVLQSNAAVTSSSLPTVHCRPPRICLLVLLFSVLLALHSCRPCIPTAPKEGTSNIIGLLHLHTYLTLPQIDQERQEHRESRNCEEQTAALAHVTRLQQEVARLKQKLADAEAANGVLQQRATPANSSQASVNSGGTPRCGPVSLCEHSAVADCTVPSDLPPQTLCNNVIVVCVCRRRLYAERHSNDAMAEQVRWYLTSSSHINAFTCDIWTSSGHSAQKQNC